MRRHRRRHRYELNADVNVVSLIDVMLLLLVIFMITAPMMQGGVDITLPSAESRPLESKDGLGITVNSRGEIYVEDTRYNLKEFKVVFPSMKNRTRAGVYLRADRNVGYGIVAQLLAIMSAQGVTNVGLVTEPEEIR
ncbi:MAG TPA: biopolymer transporter ExbD [Gemmatimonadaceae bacterium]|jgi:biopolymer transport protein TolR|nr:biopolymer transporter ExbD [Gemmatimonadaceae bacterium]